MHDAVVSIRDDTFDHDDVILAGFVDGTWPAFERSARAGLACDRLAVGRPDAAEMRAAAVAFRRSRALLAADELDAWLADRNLSRDDLNAFLRRRTLSRAHARDLDEAMAHNPVSVADVATILLAEATCDGIMRRCAKTVVEWAAAPRHEAPEGDAAPSDRVATVAAEVRASAAAHILDPRGAELTIRIGRLVDLRAAFERWVAGVASDAAIAACIDGHRMDWLRVDCTELRFDRDDAAREGAMCLREDGLQPGDVARMAGAELRDRTFLVGQADRALASLLVAARPGDVLGPLPGDVGASRVLVVIARVPPAVDDPVLIGRARSELAGAALEPLLAGNVRWHASL